MAGSEADSEYTQFGTLKVAEPLAPRDVLDVLIAGGGPGGTAAAMRALELGLGVLVLDADDLLTKIRDFHEGKDILPDYGVRKDNRPFPPGGERLTALHFEPWKREEMLERWKGYYKANNVPARIGAELTGLERAVDGTWTIKAWSKRASQEMTYRARQVVLAVGGNVARRFDIPGDLNGIHFRLDRAENFVGGPALVVGGGISAAEAVIAISNAKVKASDKTSVYWSYHGEALPRVAESKALGAAFYDAYVGNGNIRYLARSDPAAIFGGPDDCDYLSLRIDRKLIEGRPIESVHLEFAKDRVIACIGADLPFQLIESLGAKVPTRQRQALDADQPRRRALIADVFLVGDARGDKCLRCTDFNDQEPWEWIAGAAARRNIKTACGMRSSRSRPSPYAPEPAPPRSRSWRAGAHRQAARARRRPRRLRSRPAAGPEPGGRCAIRARSAAPRCAAPAAAPPPSW
jgi:thioredoxin reductase